MRTASLRALLLLSAAAAFAAPLTVACSATDATTDDADVTDANLAKTALKILGEPSLQNTPGDHSSCGFTGCHSINPVTLQGWKGQYDAAMTMLKSNASKAEKINYFRQNPSDTRTGFTPERIGILAAGSHLELGANVDPQLHPETYKQGKMITDIFAGQEDLHKEFRREMLMPVLPDFPRLTATQYETVLTWFEKGMPGLNDVIHESRPTVCQDDFNALRARTSEMKTKTWAARNFANAMPMVGCPAPNPNQPVSPTACFTQQRDGKDVFPNSTSAEFSKTWAQDGSTVRIMRELASPNSYWLRTSADGRFAATGGGNIGGAQAIDIQATLDGQSRDIGLNASYDPDFWPDNKAFMFQAGTKFCAQSLLEKPSTRMVQFSEPECSNLSTAQGLYQTVGQVVGDNSLSDRFILYSIWSGDSGSYSASARDTDPKGGADAAINVFTAVARGNDVEEGYQVRGAGAQIPTPYRGDTMMARSGTMVGSRWAYGAGPDGKKATGYALEKLDRRIVGGQSQFTLSPLGNVCLKGNKANISFDERFLITHHYNTPEDYTSSDDPGYRTKGSADVYVVDFVTGKKQKITKMGPGQFALYAHFRSDGWAYFLVVDHNTNKFFVVTSDWAVRQAEATPTP